MESLIYIVISIMLISLFLAVLPILLPLLLIILLVVGIFVFYSVYKIKKNAVDMHKKTDDFFEEAKNNYDNGVIDVEYSESEIYDEG